MAEGDGLLNRCRTLKSYRGFESLRLRFCKALIFGSKGLAPTIWLQRVLIAGFGNEDIRHGYILKLHADVCLN